MFDGGQLVAKARIAGAQLETTELRDILLVIDKAAEWREIAVITVPFERSSFWP